MSVTSCVCGAVYEKSINKDVITSVCVRSGDMRSGRNQSETDRQTAKAEAEAERRQRQKTPAGNAIATLWFSPWSTAAARALMTSSLLAHAFARSLYLSFLIFIYCVYLFSVDVTVAVAIAELLQFWSSTRVVSLESDVTFRHVACGSISGEQTKCVGVCVPVSCAPEPVKRQQNCFPWLWGKSLNTLCRYRPNRVASFHTKHSSDACTDQVSARWMSIKCILSVQVVINLIWVRDAYARTGIWIRFGYWQIEQVCLNLTELEIIIKWNLDSHIVFDTYTAFPNCI